MECDMSSPKTQRFATVLLDQGIDKPLDYLVDAHISPHIAVGSRVLVPLQKSERKGTVIELKTTSSIARIQPIFKLLSKTALISPDLFKLARWMSSYYACSLRKAVKMLFPASIRKETQAKEQLFIKRLYPPKKLKEFLEEVRSPFPSQAKVLDILIKKPEGILLTELLSQASVSKSPIETLVKQNVLSMEKIAIDRSPLEDFEFFRSPPKQLNSEQEKAFTQIKNSIDTRTFHTHLLHGITGSGKTEVYLQAIEYAKKKNLGVIFLVPEIALTSQTIERLKARLSEKLGILHHRLSDGERFDMWHSIQKGDISIVVGARSAIFSPIKNLGLIIVDEEHESSYKQTEEEPCYHARDVSIVRATFSNATVILGSATPAIESYANAEKGKYQLNKLYARASNAHLPKVHLIDMKKEYEKSGFTLFSDALIDGIKTRFERGEQTLLFLNRRGYHSFQLCTSCEKTLKCKRCDVSLTFHKKSNHLSCHLCHYTIYPPPRECPYCKHPASLKFKGCGTELVENTLGRLIPGIRTIRMDADTTRHKGSHDRLFKQFRSGKGDVLIGTQMIGKGLHFPSVTLVGVINSDSALNIPDFRASESTFQLLTQVAGRSGRGCLKGEVIIQTMSPSHPLFDFAKKEDYTGFYEKETEVRELFGYPPYSRFIKLVFSGPNEHKTGAYATFFREKLIEKLPSECVIYPAIPSGYAKVKDRFRFKVLLKGKKLFRVTPILLKTRESLPPPYQTRLLIDVDPISIFD